MANLEELVVSLVAETNGLRSELSKATKATTKATDKMDKAIGEFTSSSSKNMSIFEQAMATGIGVLGSQVILGAFTSMKDAAVDLFRTLIVDGVAAAQEHENAVQSMNQQLANAGQFSAAASKRIQSFSDELEKTSNVGAEVTLKMVGLAQAFTKTSEDAQELTAAALDFSVGAGVSFEEAIRRLGRGVQGASGDIANFAPEIRNLTKEQLAAGAATRILAERFKGAAAAATKTFSGGLKRLENSFGAVTEGVGVTITENQVLLNVFGEVDKILNDTSGSLEENAMAYKTLVGEGIILAIDSINMLVVSMDTLLRAGKAAFEGLKVGIFSLAQGFSQLLSLVGLSNDEMTKHFSDSWKEAVDSVNEAISGESGLGKVSTKLLEIREAANKGLAAIKSGAETAVEPINNAAAAVATLTAEQIKQNDALKAFAIGLAERGAATASQYEFEQALLESNLAAKTISEEEYFAAKLAMQAEHDALENEQLQTAKDANLITEQEYNDAKTELARKQALDGKKIADDQSKHEAEVQKLRIANLGSTLGTISSLSSSNSRELAAIGKAAAISTATIDGISAVQKALASAPPPFNFALAAAVGAATVANVSKIAGVGLNKGGTIRGGGANRDSVPATLTTGETVIDRTTTDALKAYLEKSTGEGQRIQIEIVMKDEAVEMIEAKIVERQAVGQSLIL